MGLGLFRFSLLHAFAFPLEARSLSRTGLDLSTEVAGRLLLLLRTVWEGALRLLAGRRGAWHADVATVLGARLRLVCLVSRSAETVGCRVSRSRWLVLEVPAETTNECGCRCHESVSTPRCISFHGLSS